MSEAHDEDDPFAERPGDREDTVGSGGVVEEPRTEEEPEPAAEEPAAEEEPASEEPAEQPVAEEPAEEEEPAPAKKDWKDKQIIKARAAEKKAREEAAADRAEIARLRALHGETPENEQPAKTNEQLRAEALAQVREETRISNINASLERVFDAGKKAFPKGWEERVAQAADAVGPEMAQRTDFLEALGELPNAHQVYFDLAGDPDRIEALLALSPAKMGTELGKLSEKLAAVKVKQISRTPAPIKPLDKPTKEERSLDDPNLSMDEFDRLMSQEEEKRWKAKQARGY